MPNFQPLPVDDTYLGCMYGKPDLERLGVFIDDGYMTGKYVTEATNYFKGKNMLSGGRKLKNATQHGYFDSEFRRLYEGEGINWKEKEKMKGVKKPPTPVYHPVGQTKWHSTPNDYFGCFTSHMEYFSGLDRPQPKVVRPKGNFTTRPVKQGGPGYVDICMSKYPEHMTDPYNKKPKPVKGVKTGPPLLTVIFPRPYFEPNPYTDTTGKIGPTYVRPKPSLFVSKGTWLPTGPCKWQGGMHAGCFEPFPEWIRPKRTPPVKKKRRKKQEAGPPVFAPQARALKTMHTAPILFKQTDASICHDNYHNYEPTYVKHLL